jgi:hypothetical protein
LPLGVDYRYRVLAGRRDILRLLNEVWKLVFRGWQARGLSFVILGSHTLLPILGFIGNAFENSIRRQ